MTSKPSRLLPAALAGVIALLPAWAAAQWRHLESLPQVQRDGNTVTFTAAADSGRTEHVAISVLSPDVVRVRFSPTPFGRDHSDTVVDRNLGAQDFRFESTASGSVIATASLRVEVQAAPFRLAIKDADGHVIDADDAGRGMAHDGSAVRVWKQLRDTDNVYGFGEKNGAFNKRGWALGGYHYVMWNSDTYGYDNSTDPIYASVPFFLVLREGRAHGVFLDNTHRSSFDIGRERRNTLSFGADGGELDYTVIAGPHPRDVVRRYAQLTGRAPLPPRWALGYHQSRWSYYPEARVRRLADTFRQERVPADTLWLDIDYQDEFKPFTWSAERFPDPAKLVSDLRAQGFRTVVILDPHPTKEPGYRIFDEGVAGDHFVKNPDGTLFEGPVWPINAPNKPGNSVFPDFTRPATRDWWGRQHSVFTDVGIAGIWNDMNEPAVWVPPANTMPDDVRFDHEGQPTNHAEVHNLYGMQMTRSTFEGLTALKPDERPFVLTRATFAGGQRYAWVWTGDNRAEWASLQQSIPMLLNFGLSGFPFSGADVGGFSGYPSGELFTRWLQAALFSPFYRGHTEQATPDQEPWSFGQPWTRINKGTIELRYRLLPTLYTAVEEASRTGLPVMRPLVLEYPDDPQTHGRGDQFLVGTDLLVAPVLVEAATSRDVYFPKGEWIDFHTGARVEGGKTHKVEAPVERLPVFVRAGSMVAMQPVVQHTGEMAAQPIVFRAFPDSQGRATGVLYDDDGESMAYRDGAFLRQRATLRTVRGKACVALETVEGRAEASPRERRFEGPEGAPLPAC
ncbi:glycoside hydrolase family 31 protein [Silanimonas sp.]|uniref:glycoside hydrolase family 31 protein n=1 Tax=Silanimonas sp. TaxID=1929290 RepID=UPI0022BD1ECE|nr:glycoside hydrolase family 31 protein [Silanimonas sp.]MCZ8116093.1 glycoside hydrolase family 31 protein [Silanimonas sp.]